MVHENLVLPTELIKVIGKRTAILKADALSISPSSEGSKYDGLCVVSLEKMELRYCWQREKQEYIN